jgi:chromosome segregation ATPase
MDQDLVAFLNQHFAAIDQRFSAMEQQIQDLREEFQEFRQDTVQRFERADERTGRLEDDVRGVHVVVEGLRGTVSLVAEGVTSVREELHLKTAELSQKIDETASFNRQAYQELEVRVRALEAAKTVRSPRGGGPRRK